MEEGDRRLMILAATDLSTLESLIKLTFGLLDETRARRLK